MSRATVSIAAAVALLTAAFASGGAVAQDPLGPTDIMRRLEVTQESVNIVEPVINDRLEAGAAIKRSARDPGQAREQLAAERERSNERLQRVLDDEQMAEWDRIQDELDADVLAGMRP
jgi:hypothetical protein